MGSHVLLKSHVYHLELKYDVCLVVTSPYLFQKVQVSRMFHQSNICILVKSTLEKSFRVVLLASALSVVDASFLITTMAR